MSLSNAQIWTLRLVAVALVCTCLDACNDSDEQPEKVIATARMTEMPDWLTVKDKIDPAVWLRSREVGHPVLISDPEVDRIRRALHQISTRFYEDPRMVVNRTAQTHDMLAEAGQSELDVDIMTGMVDVADVSVSKKLYGEMCQHYLNMRKSGKDRSASLDRLMKAYKSGQPPMTSDQTPNATSGLSK